MNMMPLSGVRVADFTAHLAGPYGTGLLALLGAQVIRIESRRSLDLSRTRHEARGCELNLNKLCITLDLKHPKGLEIAKKLVKISDIVTENFTPGVMERLGLGYSVLREIKPDIIMVSQSGMGQTGPESHFHTLAFNFASMTGAAFITGYRDGVPTELRASSDTKVGQCCVTAILAALLYRQRTGHGQYIDMSATELHACGMGEVYLDYLMNQRIQVARGNEDDFMAPHNCYRCKGDNEWVTIAVANDEEWNALCQVMQRLDLASDDRFSDQLSRWRNREELDTIISAWTYEHQARQVMEMLQEADVAAVQTFSVADIANDPHLRERGFIQQIEHPRLGKRLTFGPIWQFSQTKARINRYGPMLGEDNRFVLSELLGLSSDEISSLEEEKALY